MRAKLLQSLTRSELVSLANFDARYPKATQATRERYIVCARQRMARERANAIDWNGVPTRDHGDPELHEDLEGVAFCGPRGAWAYGRWADEPDVFTAAGIATTRSRCDLEGDLEESRDEFAAMQDIIEELGEADDREDLAYLGDIIEDAEMGLDDPAYDDGVFHDGLGTIGWRFWSHGPLGGQEAFERWLNKTLSTETVSIGSWKTMDVDFTRGEHIGRQPGTTDEDYDRWFCGKLESENVRTRKRRGINEEDIWRVLTMPEVVVRPALRLGKHRMTFQQAIDYHARRKAREEERLRREIEVVVPGVDHEFEVVGGEDPEPRNGHPTSLGDTELRGAGSPKIVAQAPLANPAFAPEFDESEYADLS